MQASPLFQGPERVESGAPFGRPTRKGAASELAVSDAARVRAALSAGDPAAAGAYLEALHPMYLFMNGTSLEWCLAWTACLAESVSPEAAAETCREVYDVWRSALEADAEAEEARSATSCAALLDPRRVGPQTVAEFRQAQMSGENRMAMELMGGALAEFGALAGALAAGDMAQARASFERYFAAVRGTHDALVRYLWTYPGVVNRRYGMGVSLDVMARAFQSLLFHGPTAQLVGSLAPDGMALFLAEHLRAHFSGPGREGSAQIIEEPDCYRVVCDPCGTGGVLRRKAQADPSQPIDFFAAASPATWGRAGDVPCYCAHCALNELGTLQILGRVAWVTEFDPDPAKPCGWTVYKDPSLVPQRYIERLRPPGA